MQPVSSIAAKTPSKYRVLIIYISHYLVALLIATLNILCNQVHNNFGGLL